MQQYVRVITDDPTDKELDYAVPEPWTSKVHIGSRVKVPLRSREILATVVALVDTPSVPNPKSILELISEIPILNDRLLKLARWMAEYYCCPIETSIRSVLPQVIRKAQLGFKRERVLSLQRQVDEAELAALAKKAPRQADVLRHAIELGGPVRWRELQLNAVTTDRTIQQLVDRGLLWVQFENTDRDPYAKEQFTASAPLVLNPEQTAALGVAMESIQTR